MVAEGDMTLSSDEVVACDGSTAAGCAGLFPSVSPVCCRAITRPGSAWVCLNQEMAFCASGSNCPAQHRCMATHNKKYFGAAGMRSVCNYPAMSARGYATPPKLFSQCFSQALAYCVDFFPVICFSPTQKGVVTAFVSERETSTDARVTGGLELVPTDGRGTDTAVSGEDVVRNPV